MNTQIIGSPSGGKGVPAPLSPSSPKLARSRYEAEIVRAATRPDGSPCRVVATIGRFQTRAGAKDWADAFYPDDYVNLVYVSALDGWVRHSAGQRRNGEWS